MKEKIERMKKLLEFLEVEDFEMPDSLASVSEHACGCGEPAMPYLWGKGPIRWLCLRCAPGAYAEWKREEEEGHP